MSPADRGLPDDRWRRPEPVILVDPARWPWRGRRWAHLVSDVSYDELHRFAARLDIPRRAFQGDHYDVPSEVRQRALQLGASAVDSRELLVRLRGAGLRLPPSTRRHRATPPPNPPAPNPPTPLPPTPPDPPPPTPPS